MTGGDPVDPRRPRDRVGGGADRHGATARTTAGTTGGAQDRRDGDTGSVTPLVIGMLVCLLILTAGVTAAGSAFLAGQRVQRLCDGAVAAAVGAVDPTRGSAAGVRVSDPIGAANEYLRVRGPDVGAVIFVGAQTVTARCRTQAPITFGVVFGVPTLERSATSVSQPFIAAAADS